jgi:hypothetical protein
MEIEDLTFVQLFWLVFAIVVFIVMACNYTALFVTY